MRLNNLKVHSCKFENFPLCSSLYKNINFLHFCIKDFAFLTLRILELLTSKVYIFLKKYATF